MRSWDKYGGKARGWSDEQYADSRAYLSHRADLVRTLGWNLEPHDVVIDLACGDGGLADFLPQQRYIGVDASEEMVEAGRALGRELVHADMNDFRPDVPAHATTIFRAIYYARDRRALFEHIAGYTFKKVVFDLNPRQYRLEDVRADLEAAGFHRLEVRPFFVPQTKALPAPLAFLLRLLERSGPLARLLLRRRFTLLCAASRSKASR